MDIQNWNKCRIFFKIYNELLNIENEANVINKVQ